MRNRLNWKKAWLVVVFPVVASTFGTSSASAKFEPAKHVTPVQLVDVTSVTGNGSVKQSGGLHLIDGAEVESVVAPLLMPLGEFVDLGEFADIEAIAPEAAGVGGDVPQPDVTPDGVLGAIGGSFDDLLCGNDGSGGGSVLGAVSDGARTEYWDETTVSRQPGGTMRAEYVDRHAVVYGKDGEPIVWAHAREYRDGSTSTRIVTRQGDGSRVVVETHREADGATRSTTTIYQQDADGNWSATQVASTGSDDEQGGSESDDASGESPDVQPASSDASQPGVDQEVSDVSAWCNAKAKADLSRDQLTNPEKYESPVENNCDDPVEGAGQDAEKPELCPDGTDDEAFVIGQSEGILSGATPGQPTCDAADFGEDGCLEDGIWLPRNQQDIGEKLTKDLPTCNQELCDPSGVVATTIAIH